MFSPATPGHPVTAKATAEISRVQFVENRAQIEILSFLVQVQLSLHRQLSVRQLAFGFGFSLLRHDTDSLTSSSGY
jgi:hypothetical protein